MMLSIRTGLTVMFAQQIHEQAALVTAQSRGKGGSPVERHPDYERTEPSCCTSHVEKFGKIPRLILRPVR
jgi:hypothetical protein